MAITDMGTVKTLALMYDISGEGAPTTATVGLVGEVYMDEDTGLTYKCTAAAPPLYTWAADTSKDMLINISLERAENDFLRIRGIPFDESSGLTLYPEGAIFTAAEMVCFLVGLGDYEGRGKKSEGFGGRSITMDDKLLGYPHSIVGGIKRYQGAR